MSQRYVAFLDRHARAIAVAAVVAVAVSIYLVAFHLPIRADFVYLLPDDSPSIRDLHELEARIPAKDTTLVILRAPDAPTRAAAGDELVAGIRAIGPGFIERLEVDDAETRAFLRAHRFLFVPYDDLVAARDALSQRIARANPLYVDLDEPKTNRLDDLRAKRRDAERKLDHSGYVSADGTTQLVVVRTSYRATDVSKDRELLHAFDRVFASVKTAHPGVEIGVAGGVPTAVAEHDAVADGILISSLLTAALVGAVLLIHLRGVRLLVLVTLQIIAATLVSFGIAAIAVGHLNSATAFLGAIIAGNGVNYGILLIARYLEERDRDPIEALAIAIHATVRPTLVASLGASISYGALAMTRFKGFSDFAIIGGVGMIVCWIVAFTVLPILLLRFARKPPRPKGEAVFGVFVTRVFGSRRPALIIALAASVTVVAGVVTWRFIASDPFEYDMAKIRSDAPAALEAQRWMRVSNTAFGKGIVGRTYLGVDSRDAVVRLVDKLRDLRDHTAEGTQTIGLIQSIIDVEPPDQARKVEVLAEIRKLVDKAADKLDDKELAEITELRPPDDLHAIGDRDLPAELVDQFREVDGRIGLVVAVRPAAGFDDLDGRAMLRFANVMQDVPATKTGTSLVFADIIDINRHDGPIVTATAGIGLVIMVLLLVGRNRRAVAVLAGTASGSLAMVAVCALVGLKINFLDFVALPIALGLGIDYAINVAHRADGGDSRITLRTTGGTVFVCSLTTMIGYASLLVSDNHAIRDFGLASLIGEVTCVVSALTLVPALLSQRSRA